MHIDVSEASVAQPSYKRTFTLSDLHSALVFVPRASRVLRRNRRRGVVSPQAIERIMLAVTEVNGCAACSWAHTKMALNAGMSSEEIGSLLNGEGDRVPQDEAKAILFAQHYADTKGLPDEDAYRAITREYGSERASIVLSAAQVMLAGNIYGGVLSAFLSRIKGKPYADSDPTQELLFLVAGACLVPVAGLEALARAASGAPNVRMR